MGRTDTGTHGSHKIYDGLDYNISGEEGIDRIRNDIWNDTVRQWTASSLEAFTDDDWKRLLEELPGQSVSWQIYFCDCIDNPRDPRCFQALRRMADTGDSELFLYVISVMICAERFDTEMFRPVYEKAVSMIPAASEQDQALLGVFVEKYDALSGGTARAPG